MSLYSENIENDEICQLLKTIPDEVCAALDEILESDDVLDRHDFNVCDYINKLFPNEQSLASIDDVIESMRVDLDLTVERIHSVIRTQSRAGLLKGELALQETQESIVSLLGQMSDIKERAQQAEVAVNRITCDIKHLDLGKRNLTATVTTLNHLHMLSRGVVSLQSLLCRKEYREISMLMEGVMNVLQHLKKCLDVPHVKELSDQVYKLRNDLASQITFDFHEAFAGSASNKIQFNADQLSAACNCLNVLDQSVRERLLSWFVTHQLQEYSHLFGVSENCGWLAHIESRFTWLKRFLIEFDSCYANIFPSDWELSERIAVEFCSITKKVLTIVIEKRISDVDAKLLLFAIQKTTQFESLLSKRFLGTTLVSALDHNIDESKNTSVSKSEKLCQKPKLGHNNARDESLDQIAHDSFQGIISSCFEPYLKIYIDSIDKDLNELIERFIADASALFSTSNHFSSKSVVNSTSNSSQLQTHSGSKSPNNHNMATILSSCSDLFLFYKRCLMQLADLTRNRPMLTLTSVFQKHLKQYTWRVLIAFIPKTSTSNYPSTLSISSSFSKVFDFKDISNISSWRDLTSSNIMQNLPNLLKEGDTNKLTKNGLYTICSILSTADYCMDTTQQLESKIREKVHISLLEEVDFAPEIGAFHSVINNCIRGLIIDLEVNCEPSLLVLIKTNWQGVCSVGDQSQYVSTLVTLWRSYVPQIRHLLAGCRNYFVQFCAEFASCFITKLICCFYKCKSISTHGAEQLLLDLHSLKTALSDLPIFGLQQTRNVPSGYAKIVSEGTLHAEMLLKVIMNPSNPIIEFVQQMTRLLPDSDVEELQKILEMKGIRKSEQTPFIEEFKAKQGSSSVKMKNNASAEVTRTETCESTGRIQRLEKLIKRKS